MPLLLDDGPGCTFWTRSCIPIAFLEECESDCRCQRCKISGKGTRVECGFAKVVEQYVQVISSASLGRGATGSLANEKHATV